MDIHSELTSLRELIHKIHVAGENRLPAEPKLAQELNVSRGRLRTLLKKVETEGLIWRHVGKGTFVGSREAGTDLENGSKDVSITEAMDARLVFEPGMAIQAALHAKPSDLKTLNTCLESMKTATNYQDWKPFDAEFHRAIAQATHNPLTITLYDFLNEQVSKNLGPRLKRLHLDSLPKPAVNQQHEKIYEAIVAHDPDAANQIMREHLFAVRSLLFGLNGE